jgi:colicin import membrane protein
VQELWSRTRAFGLAIGVHLLAAALIVLGTRDWRPFRPPDLQGLMIEAVIVDMSAIRDAQREADLAEQRELDRQRRQRELEAQRERERLEAEVAERQRKRQEDLRLQQLRQRQEQERLDQERHRQEELERIREERAAAERQRKIEEERLKQLQARNQAEAEAARQAEAQDALAEQLAREQAQFQAGRLASLNDQYHLAIQALVTQNWLRPPTTRPGLRCTVRIVQIPGGEVISANIVGGCNADEVTRRSLIAALERTGTLPYRGFEDVFQREIDFIFSYDGD